MADFEFLPAARDAESEAVLNFFGGNQNEGIRMQDTGTGQWYTYRNGAWWLDGENIDE